MEAGKRAVVLLSGGADSTTVLAIAKSQGFEVYALTFRYGQRHEFEIKAARRIADRLGVARHLVAEIDLRLIGGSALTSDIDADSAMNRCARLFRCARPVRQRSSG